jgi:hypothetical protein
MGAIHGLTRGLGVVCGGNGTVPPSVSATFAERKATFSATLQICMRPLARVTISFLLSRVHKENRVSPSFQEPSYVP